MHKLHQIAPGIAALVLVTLVSFALLLVADGQTEGAPGNAVGGDIYLNGEKSDSSFTISVSLDNPIWMIQPGTTAHETGLIKLEASDAWQISVSADRADGKMAQHDSTGYVENGKKLENSLSVKTGDNAPVDLATGGLLISGPATGNNGNQEIPLTFIQPVTWSDAALPSGQVYSLDITFVASPVLT